MKRTVTVTYCHTIPTRSVPKTGPGRQERSVVGSQASFAATLAIILPCWAASMLAMSQNALAQTATPAPIPTTSSSEAGAKREVILLDIRLLTAIDGFDRSYEKLPEDWKKLHPFPKLPEWNSFAIVDQQQFDLLSKLVLYERDQQITPSLRTLEVPDGSKVKTSPPHEHEYMQSQTYQATVSENRRRFHILVNREQAWPEALPETKADIPVGSHMIVRVAKLKSEIPESSWTRFTSWVFGRKPRWQTFYSYLVVTPRLASQASTQSDAGAQ